MPIGLYFICPIVSPLSFYSLHKKLPFLCPTLGAQPLFYPSVSLQTNPPKLHIAPGEIRLLVIWGQAADLYRQFVVAGAQKVSGDRKSHAHPGGGVVPGRDVAQQVIVQADSVGLREVVHVLQAQRPPFDGPSW